MSDSDTANIKELSVVLFRRTNKSTTNRVLQILCTSTIFGKSTNTREAGCCSISLTSSSVARVTYKIHNFAETKISPYAKRREGTIPYLLQGLYISEPFHQKQSHIVLVLCSVILAESNRCSSVSIFWCPRRV